MNTFARQAHTLDPRAVAISGIVAGAAFVAVLEADLRLTGRNVNDLIMLGCPFVNDPKNAGAVGTAIPLLNSLALACLYAVLERCILGPPWLKGVDFTNVENLILYPVTVFEDLHPAIRDGQVDHYFWPAFWQAVPRHIAFGAVLGILYDRLVAANRRES